VLDFFERLLETRLKATALVFVGMACVAGCRSTDQVIPPSVPSALNLSFKPGDYFAYTTWDLDEFGETIDGTHSKTSWTVADTGRLVRGFTGVTVVIDSVFRRSIRDVDSLAHVDSLFLRVAPNGDVFQYGLLATLLEKREKIALPQWDGIAAFSLRSGSSWVIGAGDSAANTVVYGRIVTDQEYVGTIVNGTQRVLLAYRIEITKPDLQFVIWMTDLPFGFLRLRDESTEVANGTLQDLTATNGAGS